VDASRTDLALLFRRAGFGVRPEELDVAELAGWQATVDRLLAGSGAAGSQADPGLAATPPPTLEAATSQLGSAARQPQVRQRMAQERRELALWWVDRMSATSDPWPEKLAWFWHGHFATAISKVRIAVWMLQQSSTLRAHGSGRFADLLGSMVADPAMLVWLDGRSSRRANPNENFARECMELFCLGHGNYSENDVRQLARAFTGWQIDPGTGAARYVAARHDPGPVTVLGRTGSLSSDQAVALLTGSPACAAFLAARAWSRFAAPTMPADPVAAPLVAALGPDRDLGAMWRALFTAEAFRSDTVRTGLVKQPVEWLVGLLRAARLRARDVPGVLTTLTGLGQLPFDPPNVGGWPENRAWLTAAAVLVRARFAVTVAGRGDIAPVVDAPRSDRVAATARLLSVDRLVRAVQAGVDRRGRRPAPPGGAGCHQPRVPDGLMA
jgi:uncharacterized protein (DUF1800 family)